ncbi:cGMP-inhibited 3',5'-cyclic phosphodiesterase B-like isoform X2 [Penaeus chinensis]|uniref:cGMP-inhibited 3',5'-cyclic phosphodiesterase B-like isoform X2 n=1 Tax=Penaeus chinensis TaxID=139456 RepID=UPI001FB82386|nr:cGMP-inhibited 3',5'-cyclic phosphodiesterase B-like isoform X2 [Penaeus chinensis]
MAERRPCLRAAPSSGHESTASAACETPSASRRSQAVPRPFAALQLPRPRHLLRLALAAPLGPRPSVGPSATPLLALLATLLAAAAPPLAVLVSGVALVVVVDVFTDAEASLRRRVTSLLTCVGVALFAQWALRACCSLLTCVLLSLPNPRSASKAAGSSLFPGPVCADQQRLEPPTEILVLWVALQVASARTRPRALGSAGTLVGPSAARPFLSHLLGGVCALVGGPRRPSPNTTINAHTCRDGRVPDLSSRSCDGSASSVASPQHPVKMRRTSLPAISVQRPTSSQSCGGGAATTVDGALLSEAHGLVADMLQDPHLPPSVVSGLQALYLLLAPAPNTAPSPRGPRPTPYFHLSQDAYASGSDTEENPYTGERPSIHRRSGRKSVAPSLLRRMSTSTWTTTTSATGMPTLEPTPCRKRASSFRAVVADVTPCGSPTHACCLETQTRLDPTCSPKSRSYSTTALYQGAPRKPAIRERQTVCSLHPLGDYDVNHLDRVARGLHDGANSESSTAYSDRLTRLQKLPNQHVCEGLCEDCTRAQHDVPEAPFTTQEDLSPMCECNCNENIRVHVCDSIVSSAKQTETLNNDANSDATNANIVYQRRALRVATSDYESSDSPCSIEAGEEASGAPRGRLAGAAEVAAAVMEEREEEEEEQEEEQEIENEADGGSNTTNKVPNDADSEVISHGVFLLPEDGATFDLDLLQEHPLLNRISEWDYPIFDLQDMAGNLILSQLCYQVFSEVGLFETFKIPTKEFLSYFHALELGYREIPYHNRTHASDVLHSVYYLTSQPIPGFIMLPPEPVSPTDKHDEVCGSPRLVHRQSFTAEDTYGILGANLPALELMALYTAAAMHDYDHPGRTNAFLVTTNAPQAVLYNDRSVLENHHAAAAWSLFLSKPEYNFLTHLDRAEFKRFRFLVIEAILATDLKRHFEILAEFNAKSNEPDAPGLDWSSETDRLLALQMCIKLADINGPCKALDIHTQWTRRIAEEFYEQGDEEQSLGLPISPYMDRTNPQLSKLQESFINHLVAPLCNAYGEAGLMPGVWQDSCEDEDAEPNLKLDEFPDEEDDDPPTSESDTATQNSGRTRKIFCLQTQHLQENHQHWVNKIKEEQRLDEQSESGSDGEEAAAAVDVSPCSYTPQPMVLPLNGDEPMEPIEEERTPASMSSSRSFSFEKEDSKL